ncbi:MAG: response regulator transcription factor [Phycisphaerae bacterium]|nr:response regulator transcription factor [Gemmatimonadaceae bacterium]
MRILLAEDDQQLLDTVARGLREQSFVVDTVSDGPAALTSASVNEYAAIVLDVLMPGRDGFAVCRELRGRGVHTPILMLTARDAVHDRITGLDAGADDYLTKPFAMGELFARLRARVRRQGNVRPETIHVGDLLIDTRRHVVTRAGRVIVLTAREFTFLAFLARNAGRVVSRVELAENVWDDNHDPNANLIDVYVSRIRRKLDAGSTTSLLRTRRGAGVMLSGDEPALGESAIPTS